MLHTLKFGTYFIPVAALLAGCSSQKSAETCTGPSCSITAQKPQAAHHWIIDDVSASSEAVNDDAYGQGVQRKVGELVNSMKLGDSVTIYPVGARTAERAVPLASVVTGYRLRLPAARNLVLKQLKDISEHFGNAGGDSGSNILLTLEAHPVCTANSEIDILSDSIEESDAYSASTALNAGKPVDLPAPPGPYLRGCSVHFIGFGVTKDARTGGQVLPSGQLNALREGWTKYLRAAGVTPENMTFTSIL